MPALLSLGALLSRSLGVLRRESRVLIPGVLVASFLILLMQMVVGQRVGIEMGEAVRAVVGGERYEQFLQEAQKPGASAESVRTLSLQLLQEIQAKVAEIPEQDQGAYFLSLLLPGLRRLLPVLLLFVPLLILLSLWAQAFFFHVALAPRAGFGAAVGRATHTFLPLLAVYIAAFLASFAWLPFLALAFAPAFPPLFFPAALLLIVPVILGPRFALAPVAFLHGGGIVRSIRESYRKSRGYWGKIVGNLLVAALLTGIVLWILTALTDIAATILVSSTVLILFAWLRQAFTLGAAAYRTVFLAELSGTLLGQS